jgi:azurin
MKYSLVVATVLTLAFAAACTKKEEAPSAPATQAAAAPAATQAAAPAQATGKVDQEVQIGTDGDNLYFNKKEITAKAGSTIRIVFKNNASEASGLSHNFVITKPGTKDQVANDSMQAGEDKNWVAEGPNVIAHTKLVKPGSTESITFTLPAAGEYNYLCTYPGHGSTMSGVLKVQ